MMISKKPTRAATKRTPRMTRTVLTVPRVTSARRRQKISSAPAKSKCIPKSVMASSLNM